VLLAGRVNTIVEVYENVSVVELDSNPENTLVA
jgi:hypothetical protein